TYFVFDKSELARDLLILIQEALLNHAVDRSRSQPSFLVSDYSRLRKTMPEGEETDWGMPCQIAGPTWSLTSVRGLSAVINVLCVMYLK
ncbi:hypothetical protein, partial [Pseudomonas helleri]|uniref:hypothetical protein n=1 Tax=Pseudomonas helleri TaxID=1608996 RepID=UPI003FD0846E